MIGAVWQNFTDTVTTTQQLHPIWVVVGTGVIALLLVGYRPVWRITRTAVTIVHEGGHALVAVLVGRRLEGIHLHSDTSGVAISRGRPTGLGVVATAAAGYPMPALIGLGCAALLGADKVTGMLWVGVALLAATLAVVRNGYGVFAVLVTGLLLAAIAFLTPTAVRAAFAYLIAWFLLFGGMRPVSELQARRSRHQSPDSDADQLGRLTGLPGFLWVAVFGLINLTCLVFGASWLLHLL